MKYLCPNFYQLENGDIISQWDRCFPFGLHYRGDDGTMRNRLINRFNRIPLNPGFPLSRKHNGIVYDSAIHQTIIRYKKDAE